MPKSLGKIWLKGFTRLLKIQKEHTTRLAAQRKKARAAGKKAPAAFAQTGNSRARAAARDKAAALHGTATVTAEPSSAVNQATPRSPRRRGDATAGRVGRSATRPAVKAHARPQGKWLRSFFSAPPAAGELVNHLAYGLYLPPASPAARLPLVVMLHGCQQNIEDFAHGTRMNLLADRYGFAVLYPEQSKHAQAHRCWHWYDESARAGAKEVAAVAALVEAMIERHGIDSTRVYAAGMSAGAGMTVLLALRYPRLFAAVGLHSAPALGGAQTPAGALGVMQRGVRGDPLQRLSAAVNLIRHPGMPALIVQGEVDPVIAAVNADQLELQFLALNGAVQIDGKPLSTLRVVTTVIDTSGADARTTTPAGAAGAAVALRDYRLDHRLIVRTCRVKALAHGWSGGDSAFAFNSSRGPDASSLMWDFFSRWQRV